MVTTPEVSITVSCLYRSMKSRPSRPAPLSSTSANASSATSNPDVHRRPRTLPPPDRLSAFNVSLMSVFEVCHAGSSPNAHAEAIDRRPTNAYTIAFGLTSTQNGRLDPNWRSAAIGSKATAISRTPYSDNPNPTAPPASAISRHSARS